MNKYEFKKAWLVKAVEVPDPLLKTPYGTTLMFRIGFKTSPVSADPDTKPWLLIMYRVVSWGSINRFILTDGKVIHYLHGGGQFVHQDGSTEDFYREDPFGDGPSISTIKRHLKKLGVSL